MESATDADRCPLVSNRFFRAVVPVKRIGIAKVDIGIAAAFDDRRAGKIDFTGPVIADGNRIDGDDTAGVNIQVAALRNDRDGGGGKDFAFAGDLQCAEGDRQRLGNSQNIFVKIQCVIAADIQGTRADVGKQSQYGIGALTGKAYRVGEVGKYAVFVLCRYLDYGSCRGKRGLFVYIRPCKAFGAVGRVGQGICIERACGFRGVLRLQPLGHLAGYPGIHVGGGSGITVKITTRCHNGIGAVTYKGACRACSGNTPAHQAVIKRGIAATAEQPAGSIARGNGCEGCAVDNLLRGADGASHKPADCGFAGDLAVYGDIVHPDITKDTADHATHIFFTGNGGIDQRKPVNRGASHIAEQASRVVFLLHEKVGDRMTGTVENAAEGRFGLITDGREQRQG